MHTDATKRIPKSIGTDAQLYGTYTLTDVAVGLLPGVAVLLVMQVVVPANLAVAGYAVQSLTLPLTALAICLGAVFVSLTPPYTSSLTWLETMVGFHTRAREADHDAAKAYTRIEKIHAEEGALERDDGALVGMVQVSPASMALATDEHWRSVAESFQGFLNTTVEFPIQLYATTKRFPVEEYIAHYEARLDDADVRSNPRLQALIHEYIAWYESELEQRRMTIRDHYVIVSVTPEEVQFEHESLTQKLSHLPLLGVAVRAWLAPSLDEEREAMLTELDERLRRVELGIREIEGCSARRVGVADLTRLVASFWHGSPVEMGDVARRVRTTPIVGGAR